MNVKVGVYYCTVHDGVMNEDDEVCDFAVPDRAFDVERDVKCDRHQLFYEAAQ